MRGLHNLTIEQLLFIEHFVEHRDAADAFIHCSPEHKDLPKANAFGMAKRWLEDSLVIGEINRRIRVQLTVNAISQAEIADELRKVAFFDMRDLFDKNGELKRVTDFDDDTARALAQFEVIQQGERGNLVKISPANKIKALELLGKYRRMFTEKIEIENTGSIEVNINWVDAPPKEGGELPPEEDAPDDAPEDQGEPQQEAGPGGFD